MTNCCGVSKMNKTKLLGTIGLARRAGKLLLGEETILSALKKNQVNVVFLASDTGPNTTKRISDKTKFHGVQLITALSSDEMAGASGRKTLKVAGIGDKNFTILIQKAICEQTN